MSDIHHYIQGKRAEGTSERWGDVYNPATGERSRRVAFASAGDVDRAVRAAAAAFDDLAIDIVPNGSAHGGVLRGVCGAPAIGRLGDFRGDEGRLYEKT